MSESLPPPIGANRVDADEADESETMSPLSGPSARTRIVVAVVALALAVGVGVVGYRFIAVNDDEGGSNVDVPGWNAVAIADGEQLTIVDENGDELDTFDGFELGATQASGRFVLAQTDTTELIDTADGERTELDVGDLDRARFLQPGASLLMFSSIQLGNARIVDPTDDIDIDVAAIADLSEPRIFDDVTRYDRDENVVGVVDESSFQSILVPLDDPAPVFLRGRLADLRHGTALTVETVGGESDVHFYDFAGVELGSVAVEQPRAAMLTGPETALVVAGSGELVELGAGAESPDEITTLEVDSDTGPTPFLFMPAVERLAFASGERTVTVVDLSGEPVLEEEGEIRTTSGTSLEQQSCLTIAQSDGDQSDPAPTQIYDLVSGETIGDEFDSIDGPIGGSLDGCTVTTIGSGDTPSVVSGRNRTFELDGSVTGLAPDGSAYTYRTDGDEATSFLVDTDADEEDPIEIPSGLTTFVER